MASNALIILLFGIFVVVNGQIQLNGICNNVTTQSMFNITKFLGEWYEVEKYPTVFHAGASCLTVNYKRLRNGTIAVENVMSLYGHNVTIHGTVEEINPTGHDGKLKLQFPGLQLTNTEYWILGTDYTSYSVVWYCSQHNNTNDQYAWILSRTPNETEAQRTEVYKILQNNKLNVNQFIKVNQTHCVRRKGHKKNNASAATPTPRVTLTLVLVAFTLMQKML